MAAWGEDQVRSTTIRDGPAGKLPFMQTLGLDQTLEFDAVAHGETVFVWNTRATLAGMDRYIMGGIVGVVADICQGHTFMSHLERFVGFSTGDIMVRFLAPVIVEETVRVESRISHTAEKLVLIDTSFRHASGKILATAQGGWRFANRSFEKPSA